ncbi:MAG: tatAd 1 [Firmicutes bacterium]|nr:tatAd 1 [Bacillota bacterium]
MFSFSMPELVVILVIALIVFGPGKLPEVGKAIGKGIQEFRRASNDVMNPKEEPINIEAKATTEIKQPEEKK